MMSLLQLLESCKVLPVITPLAVDSTVRLAQALNGGGMKAVEITLRTPTALESLQAVKAALPKMLVAAGTVTSAAALERARRAGADFCVSPGSTESLLRAATDHSIPLLPGVATASEVMFGVERGYELFKLFPAVQAGGINLLRALAGPFPGVKFCPTGGLSSTNFREFLAMSNVACCGGSWMTPDALLKTGSWDEIERLAREVWEHANEADTEGGNNR